MTDYYKGIAKLLSEHGWHRDRTKGSHEQWKNKKGNMVTVPKTSKSRHTFNAVLKDAGINTKV